MRILRVIDILKKIKCIIKVNLRKKIDRSFMIIRIKMTVIGNFIKINIKRITNMIIKFSKKINITNLHLDMKVIIINRDIKLEEEDIKRASQEVTEGE
jgi:hypothetical protein